MFWFFALFQMFMMQNVGAGGLFREEGFVKIQLLLNLVQSFRIKCRLNIKLSEIKPLRCVCVHEINFPFSRVFVLYPLFISRIKGQGMQQNSFAKSNQQTYRWIINIIERLLILINHIQISNGHIYLIVCVSRQTILVC